MMDRDSDDRLSHMIDELGAVDPPAGLTRRVMAQISQEAQHKVQGRIIPFNRGGIAMTRKAMWGLAAAAVIVLGVYTITGFPPVGRGTEGTIGAAQKYQAPQIASKDVVLGDASVQQFLQSELFDQLAKDPEARDLVTNASIKAALEDAEMRKAIENQDVRNVLSNKAVHQLFDNADMRAELESQLKANMSAEAVKKAMASDVRGGQARAAVARVLGDASVRQALQRDAVRKALDNGDLRKAMADVRMARALNNAALVRALSNSGFAASLRTNALATALANEAGKR